MITSGDILNNLLELADEFKEGLPLEEAALAVCRILTDIQKLRVIRGEIK